MSSATATETSAPLPKPSGLEGIVAASTALSHVFGEEGRLVYRGYEIHELAGRASFEEVAFLLYHGHLPVAKELADFQQRLNANRTLPQGLVDLIRSLPADTPPMDALRTGVSALGNFKTSEIDIEPDIDEALILLGSVPSILATFHRHRQGLDPIAPRDDLNTAQSYLYQLFGEEPSSDHWQPLETYLILLADHGLNASTFTARVIASTGSDICSAVTGAIGALKGPLHGGAPSLVLDMLNEIGTAENVDAWLTNALDSGQRLMGFGHRVYKAEDPRAEVLRGLAERASDPAFFALSHTTEKRALEMLEERKPGRRLYTNVEFYSAAVLAAVGLPGDMFTPTFAVSRTAGYTAHVLEQVANNRLIRPQSEFVGPTDLHFTPINDR
ncbi:MAG TPA: citrate/2-methylcitrate synthase [Thermomicrobiales bacterium]|jgi:citrate synthase|nr:citrate/2-methylcitrate synthase [Thermomicrobiales bacterium]